MTCDEAVERIPAFVAGELAPPVRAALQRHLDGCASCRAWLLECEASHQLWRRLEDGTAPAFVQATVPSPGFVDAVMAQIRREPPLQAPAASEPAHLTQRVAASEPAHQGKHAAATRRIAVPPRTALVHYALAASLALLLLQAGFFEQWVALAADEWPKTVAAELQGLLSHAGGPPLGGFMGGIR